MFTKEVKLAKIQRNKVRNTNFLLVDCSMSDPPTRRVPLSLTFQRRTRTGTPSWATRGRTTTPPTTPRSRAACGAPSRDEPA